MSPPPNTKAEDDSPGFKRSPVGYPTTPSRGYHPAPAPLTGPPPHQGASRAPQQQPSSHHYHPSQSSHGPPPPNAHYQYGPPGGQSEHYARHQPGDYRRHPQEDYHRGHPAYSHHPQQHPQQHPPQGYHHYEGHPHQVQKGPPETQFVPLSGGGGPHGAPSDGNMSSSGGGVNPGAIPNQNYSAVLSRSFEVVTPSTMTNPPAGATTFPCTCPAVAKIPRPRNAFILYRQKHQHVVSNAHPGLPNPEISKIIGRNWKKEDEEVRSQYKLMAEQEKLEHQRKHPDYRYQPKRAAKPGQRDDPKFRCGKCGGIVGGVTPAASGPSGSTGPARQAQITPTREMQDGRRTGHSHTGSLGSRSDYLDMEDEDVGKEVSTNKRMRYHDGSYIPRYQPGQYPEHDMRRDGAHLGYDHPQDRHVQDYHGHRHTPSGSYGQPLSAGYPPSQYPPAPPHHPYPTQGQYSQEHYPPQHGQPPPHQGYAQGGTPHSTHSSHHSGPLPPPDDRRALPPVEDGSPYQRRPYPAAPERSYYSQTPASPRTITHPPSHAYRSADNVSAPPPPPSHLTLPPPGQRHSISQQSVPEQLKLPPLQTLSRADSLSEPLRRVSISRDPIPRLTSEEREHPEASWRISSDRQVKEMLDSLETMKAFWDLTSGGCTFSDQEYFLARRRRGLFVAVDGLGDGKTREEIGQAVKEALTAFKGIGVMEVAVSLDEEKDKQKEKEKDRDRDPEDVVMGDGPTDADIDEEEEDRCVRVYEVLGKFQSAARRVNRHITSVAKEQTSTPGSDSSAITQTPFPIALIPTGYRLALLSWLLRNMDVPAFTQFKSRYDQLRMEVESLPGPDLTVLVREGEEGAEVEMETNGHAVLIVRIGETGLSEAAGRRVKFEVGEFLAGRVPAGVL